MAHTPQNINEPENGSDLVERGSIIGALYFTSHTPYASESSKVTLWGTLSTSKKILFTTDYLSCLNFRVHVAFKAYCCQQYSCSLRLFKVFLRKRKKPI